MIKASILFLTTTTNFVEFAVQRYLTSLHNGLNLYTIVIKIKKTIWLYISSYKACHYVEK